MLKLIIEDDEGRKTVVPFVRDEITIGRQEGNTIRLTERNVSRRHARLVRLNGHVVVEDLGSYNGTRINGEKIAGQSPLKEGDLIQIGDYDLALQTEGAASVAGPITTKVPTPRRQELPRTEPALEAMSSPGAEEEDDTSDEPGSDEDGDEHDHTPPSSSADQRRHSTSIIRLDQVEAGRPRKVADVPTDEAPRLVVLTPDELKGQEFACVRTELRIGRTDDNDITLDHRSLSRTHAKLVREDTGEWRVIDMQSANGLTVNGESYAQATLGSGDVIELGHVKLRFLNSGDAADGVPVSEGGASRSKLPLVAGFVALLLGAGAVTFYFMGQQQGTQPVPPVTPVAVKPSVDPEQPGTEPAPQPATVDPGRAAVAPETPPAAPETPPAPKETSLEERLGMAREALQSQQFDKAEGYLSNARDKKGNPSKEAEELLVQTKYERTVKRRLDTARTALKGGKLDEAEAELKQSDKTQVFASDHAALLAQLSEERKNKAAAAAAAVAPPAAPKNDTTATSAQAPAEPSAAEKTLKEGREHLKAKRYARAVDSLRKCLTLEPEYLDCHMLLGSALANVGKSEESILHYRRFLELAPPTHPQFNRVKSFLEEDE
ncbi:FHA domain-containing protein [Pyxidicoccus xibeiensis]|uniref:FHA domain-containing protein n=1 Tax=Pyxidicoccus xibeiensis TaxID=2906759 RepID=UPI0020A7AF57|nr:FHA domain-containing protein [Pyxidicoccus xibeiensis]MCP3145276.1 FHA domain-containing protein [Pyxidicoccus xibeiensis]